VAALGRPGAPLGPGLHGRIAFTALGLLAFACGESRRAAAPPVPDFAAVARARAAATALGGDLVAMLTRELARGGPVAAIAVCADSAQEKTRLHQAEGVQVRRVGTRIRNPANTPDSVEAAVLAAFAAALSAGRLPADTFFVTPAAGGGHELRYLRPVRVQEPCLACHGPASGLAPEVRALLAARYPGDHATDYAVGDLRGAVSVRLRLQPAPAD
jgi:hypothetical protein